MAKPRNRREEDPRMMEMTAPSTIEQAMASAEIMRAVSYTHLQSWEVTSLPEGAEKTGSANISYSGTDATITLSLIHI